MKKFFTIAAFIAIGFSANAQQEVKFGPKAGVNFASLSNTENSKMLTGFYVGGVAEIKFSDKFSVQPELMYSAQGVKTEISVLGITATGTQKIDYINIPILAKYYIAEGFSVEAGPQFGFLVKAEGNGSVSASGVSGSDKTDNKDSFKAFDFGIGAGLAYDLSNGFFVNARYNFGLSDISKEKEDGQKSINNGVIQVGVGYKF